MTRCLPAVIVFGATGAEVLRYQIICKSGAVLSARSDMTGIEHELS